MVDVMSRAIEGYQEVRAERLLGIFGNPIRHTLSPLIHDTLSEGLEINERYIPFHIEDNLGDYVKNAYDTGILGLNITVPYKQEVMQYLVDTDEAALAIGAVNTLVRAENGYKGYNTDMPGLARALASEGIELSGKQVIMLGAGGAARAVAYMCMKYGAERTYIVNRTYEKAFALAEDMNRQFQSDRMVPITAADYGQIPRGQYIFIQCTSVGLHEGDGLPLISEDDFYRMAICGVDLIYNPERTPFIRKLEQLGIRAVNGLKMLLYQGILAYELWNEVTVSDELAERVYKRLALAVYGRKIILIGYMGAGKTTVGRYISQKFGYAFVDTDAYIVEKAGMTINDIFEKHGEAYFRELETEAIRELKGQKGNMVIATGGGLPLREENRKYLHELGEVYFLRARAETIYDRVKGNGDRPLLACADPLLRIREMLRERTPIYEQVSDRQLDTDNMTLEAAAAYIMEQ